MTISDKALLQVLLLLEESDNLAINMESDDLRLTARKGNAAVILQNIEAAASVPPMPTMAEVSKPAEAQAAPSSDVTSLVVTEDEGVVVVRSPMKGTFYRAPAPGEPPFCNVGDWVGPDNTVCLVEIMKLFNSISAGISGTVEQYFVENAEPVDLNQPIVSIRVE